MLHTRVCYHKQSTKTHRHKFTKATPSGGGASTHSPQEKHHDSCVPRWPTPFAPPLGWEPWLGKGVWGLGPGACGAPSLLHTRCAAPQTTATREQLPAALGTDGSRTQWPKCGRSKIGRRCCGCVALPQSRAPERKRVRLRM